MRGSRGYPGVGGYPGDPGDLSIGRPKLWQLKVSRRQAAEKIGTEPLKKRETAAEGGQHGRLCVRAERFRNLDRQVLRLVFRER